MAVDIVNRDLKGGALLSLLHNHAVGQLGDNTAAELANHLAQMASVPYVYTVPCIMDPLSLCTCLLVFAGVSLTHGPTLVATVVATVRLCRVGIWSGILTCWNSGYTKGWWMTRLQSLWSKRTHPSLVTLPLRCTTTSIGRRGASCARWGLLCWRTYHHSHMCLGPLELADGNCVG